MKKTHSAFSLVELSIVILIIGIIIAGVTQASSLVRKMKIETAQSLTKSSEVNSIKDLTFWGETTLSESLVSTTNNNDPQDGDLISTWNDINPTTVVKINPTQATDGNRPTYVQNGIGGLPSLSFDGVNDVLSSTTLPVAAGDRDYMMFAVWQTNSVSVAQTVISTGGTATSGAAMFFLRGNGNFGFAAIGNDVDFMIGTVRVRKPYVTGIRVNNSRNLTFYNASVAGVDRSSPLALNLGGMAFAIGSNPGLFQRLNGMVAEVIVFDRALLKEEIATVMKYLGKKYGISIS